MMQELGGDGEFGGWRVAPVDQDYVLVILSNDASEFGVRFLRSFD
jgi:hypothetical protein